MTQYAHLKPDGDSWSVQSIDAHCHGVAALAQSMAQSFDAQQWAYLCGLWHDVGKYSPQFQRHIIAASGFDPSVRDPGKVDHSTAGAWLAQERLGDGWSLPVSYCIVGHHAGLMDFIGDGGRQNLKFHLSADERHLLDEVRPYLPNHDEPLPQLPAPKFDSTSSTPKAWHLWIRMLFSCLVDADWLDTERFMQPANFAARSHFSTLPQLKEQLDRYLQSLAHQAKPTPVNVIRARVQQVCRVSGQTAAQGIFSLTVPTGGGKTLSSLLWAMEHAMRHQLNRIVIAIPYTSIVSQTADTLRKIFGPHNVVEHHSYVDFSHLPEREQLAMNLAVENWDAPIIVTTNVQLFESLYASKPSRCRKLHNLDRSVLILDEVQMLPATNLRPIVDVLDSLCKYMGVSILLTTATQPALSGTIGSGQAQFAGLHSQEIVADTHQLFDQMRRVNFVVEPEPFSHQSLAQRLAQCPQVLCVVNTRADARQVYDLLPDQRNACHLSRMMCQQHIADRLAQIKEKLAQGQPVQVVSTQLIEAGVDVDFPEVWRAMAGLDSIAQSAGRCNREGKLARGQVHVFTLTDSHLRGIMAKAASATADLLAAGESDFLDPDVAQTYFKLFYAKVNSTDQGDVARLLYRFRPEFESAAQAFRMIDDASLTVYVPYAEGAALLARLRRGECSASLLRALQRYSVSLPLGRRDEVELLGAVKLSDYVYALPDCGSYDDNTGLSLDSKWLDQELIL